VTPAVLHPAADLDALAASIDAVLPQTQCTRCGYDGCAPYARAVAEGAADIDRCPPGGDAGAMALAALTGRAPKPVDRTRGEPGPLLLAAIDETACIGCTLCILACPVDAIIGAQKRMHAVLASLCSGCELCVPACPVDCIDMVVAARPWTDRDAAAARERHVARNERVALRERIVNRRAVVAARASEADRRKAAVDAALARARARRQARDGT
jgi:electron transport complex protein RnfB